MRHNWLAVLLGALVLANPIWGQAPAWEFRWKTGQALKYQISQATKIFEKVGDKESEVVSKLNLIKRWEVMAVDDQGVATLKMSIVSMRYEMLPGRDGLVFDSAHPDESTPTLKDQMRKYVGKTLAILRVDRAGKVVEVRQGSAAQFESDPPLALRLPPAVPAAGKSWERLYQVTLEPPHGTGEKFKGTQRYTVTKVADGLATVHVTTKIDMPEGLTERMALLQKQPAGEVVFNINLGRVQSVDYRIDESLQDHQGVGSRYRFQSSYRARYVE